MSFFVHVKNEPSRFAKRKWFVNWYPDIYPSRRGIPLAWYIWLGIILYPTQTFGTLGKTFITLPG